MWARDRETGTGRQRTVDWQTEDSGEGRPSRRSIKSTSCLTAEEQQLKNLKGPGKKDVQGK